MNIIKRRWVGFLTLCCLTGSALADEDTPLYDVTDHLPDLVFSLTGDDGKVRTAEDMRGRVMLMYFGFTSCPDRCPIAMARLASVIEALGSEAAKVKVLFVSIDPARDTPPVLHRYLSLFKNVPMIGLTGDAQAIAELTKRYRAAYRPGHLTHSDTIYVFDAQGHAHFLGVSSDSIASFTTAIGRLLHESP